MRLAVEWYLINWPSGLSFTCRDEMSFVTSIEIDDDCLIITTDFNHVFECRKGECEGYWATQLALAAGFIL